MFVLGIAVCLCTAYAQELSSAGRDPSPMAQTVSTISLTANATASPAATGGYNYTVAGSATVTSFGTANLTASGFVSDISSLKQTTPIAGNFTFDFGGGNTMTGSFSIPAGIFLPQIGGSTSATGTLTISGGTGKYAGATGFFSNLGGMGTATGIYTSSFTAQCTGTITTGASTASGAASMAHYASGGGWTTIITLINTGSAAANVEVDFYDENGNAVSLAVTFPQSPQSGSSTLASVRRLLNPGAVLLIQTGGQTNLSVGSIGLVTDGTVTGFAIFRFDASGQEATVPVETRNPSAFLVSFDNTGGLSTGVALANVSAQTGAIKVIIRDDTGAALGSDTISLPGHGHIQFILTSRYGLTANLRGSLEFQTPSGGQISVTGLAFTPQGAITTLPAINR